MDWSDPEAVRAYQRAYYRKNAPPKRESARAAAKRLGLPTYKPENPCPRGHDCERQTKGGHCIECQRGRERSPERLAQRRALYQADLDESRRRGREQRRRQYAKNRERELKVKRAARSAAYAADPEYYRKQNRRRWPDAVPQEVLAARAAERRDEKERKSQERAAYAAASKDRQRELRRAWRVANPGYMANWRAENREKTNAYKRGRKLRRRTEIVTELTKLQRGRCAYCRVRLTPANRHVDHIEPRKLGGGNARRNLQLACDTCNGRKSAKDPIIFAQELGRLL